VICTDQTWAAGGRRPPGLAPPEPGL